MINEYLLNPYPRRMWVAIGENFDEVKLAFNMCKEDMNLTGEEVEDEYEAIVFTVSKETYAGYLVFITNPSTTKTLAHESLHVALNVYRDCNMEVSTKMDQEPLCYLLGYVFSILENDVNKYKNESSRSESNHDND